MSIIVKANRTTRIGVRVEKKPSIDKAQPLRLKAEEIKRLTPLDAK